MSARLTTTVVLVLGATCVFIASAHAKPKPTVHERTGAFTYNAAQYKLVEKVSCALVGTKWQSGAKLPTGKSQKKFLTDVQRAANFTAMAKRASGKAAKQLRRKAQEYRTRAKSNQLACQQPNGAYRGAMVQQSNGVVCGTMRGNRYFVPGAVSGVYFTSLNQLLVNAVQDARFAKGAAKKRFAARVAALKSAMAQSQSTCQKLNNGGYMPWTPRPATPLRLQTKGGVGLALRPASFAVTQPTVIGPNGQPVVPPPSSNLTVVEPNGATRDAAVSGNVQVSQFLTAPDGTTYVAFQAPVNLDDTGSFTLGGGCVLARLTTSSDVPVCVDADLQFINGFNAGYNANSNANPSIQFDASGSVYYLGTTRGSSAKTVLRRFAHGAITDLIADYVSVQNFLVRPDGSVFVMGQSTATNTMWTRRVRTTGSLQTVFATGQPNFLAAFPDGNVYMGTGGIERYDETAGAMDPVKFSGPSGDVPPPTFDASDCFGCGTSTTRLRATSNGAVFSTPMFKVAKLFPEPEYVTTTIDKAYVTHAIGSYLLVAGLDASDRQRLVRMDTTQDPVSETVLLDASDELEIFHMTTAPTVGNVLFDGLRFSDNKYVFGEIDVATGAVTVRAAIGERWNDFQALIA